MTTLNYRVIDGVGEFRDCKFASCTDVEISVEGYEEGYIQIGDIVTRVRGNSVKVNLSPLNDGTYTPLLVLKDKVIPLEKIRKKNLLIDSASFTEETLRRVLIRLEKLENLVADHDSKIKKHNDAIYGKFFI